MREEEEGEERAPSPPITLVGVGWVPGCPLPSVAAGAALTSEVAAAPIQWRHPWGRVGVSFAAAPAVTAIFMALLLPPCLPPSSSSSSSLMVGGVEGMGPVPALPPPPPPTPTPPGTTATAVAVGGVATTLPFSPGPPLGSSSSLASRQGGVVAGGGCCSNSGGVSPLLPMPMPWGT